MPMSALPPVLGLPQATPGLGVADVVAVLLFAVRLCWCLDDEEDEDEDFDVGGEAMSDSSAGSLDEEVEGR